MQGPTPELRRELVERLQGIDNRDADGNRFVDESVEAALSNVLDWLGSRLTEDLATSDEEGYERLMADGYGDQGVASGREPLADFILAVVDSWASLLSFATTWVYAPFSPLPSGQAGASTWILSRIRGYAQVLTAPAGHAASLLGASAWSVSVGLPFGGVSVGLEWDV